MTKFCVKKPYFIVVAVIIVLTIGIVSMTKMQTDLIPDMELPYMIVITTQPGATPEKVENDVTKPIESVLGTINGVDTISSTSAENYSMVMLEFADNTDMDSALVRVSKALNTMELPEECGVPNIMEVSADMMATMYASVEYKGKDIKELSSFTEKVVKPYLERQEGVASVSGSGSVENTVEIRLNKEKIDEINDEILLYTNKKLADAQSELDAAKTKLEEGEAEIKKQKKALEKQQSETNSQLGDASVQLSKAQATKIAYESSLNSLNASKTALEAEKKAYEDAKLAESYESITAAFAGFQSSLSEPAKQFGIEIPASVEDAINNPEKLKKFTDWMIQMGYGDKVANLTAESLQQVYNIVEVRLPQIEAELANLAVEIKAAQAVLDTISKEMKGMDDKHSEAIAGGYGAATEFGSAKAQLAAAEEQMKTAKSDLEAGIKQLEESKKAALENSNIDALLSLDTLAGLITAQNFSMPAGYVEDKSSRQWMVKVGESYENESQLNDMVLTKVPGVGAIKLSEVADVTVVSNAGESYAKINGEDAILLSLFKSSTSNTSTVSGNLKKAFEELEQEYSGLAITPMIDQGAYIEMMIESIVTSILLGALLAVIVLALFLKAVKPTLIVAFSIPFSVLFAIILMYFTDITLNVMSLGGLCLGIGMLVDNSIVVIENVYRLINRGFSPARAAVQGAKQVAGPIIASTVTTICVFFPMVYVSGMISQLMLPFAFTISYALIASLIVALTVVPTMASAWLENTGEKTYKWFDAMKEGYGRALEFCLNVKAVPLAVAIVLFVICVYQAGKTGLVIMSDTESNQIMATMTLDEETEKEEAYKIADDVMSKMSKAEGVSKVAVMDGNSGAASSVIGGSDTAYLSYSFFIIPDKDITTIREIRNVIKDVEKKVADIECEELNITASAMGSVSELMNAGMQVDIFGESQEKLFEISNDIVAIMENIEGLDNVTNGITEEDKQIHLEIDKDKVAKNGLTVAQIYQQLAGKLATDKTAITLSMDDTDVEVKIVDETDKVTYENILDTNIKATTMDEEGKEVSKEYKLSKFATLKIENSAPQLTRNNQTQYMSVTAETKEGYNTTLIARDLQKVIDNYEVEEGYTVEINGESEQVMEMLEQMLLAIALGFLLIYLVMVAQFQSLLSPFIIIFTIPLAFTGGMIGLILFGEPISAIALLGFMILMGTVVNNGIVFVDYVNQLRLQGVDKHTALVVTGKVRMRPILMTAMTTILSMSVMVISQDAAQALQKPMAIVVCFGLIYSTIMTLFIVPIMYDILYRREPKEIDVGDDNLDEIPDETEEVMIQLGTVVKE